jgi:aryl-alcohol dehydrogenase-like predicted oxidoreductase
MKRLELGSTGITVSPVCCGTWQMDKSAWGDVSHDALIAAVRRAPDVGVNFFDTADAYGDGLAETLLGEALATFRREEVVIATKVFTRHLPDGRRFGDLSRRYIFDACDASLKRLRTDYIDLYQCHDFDITTPIEETAEAMKHLRRAGKIRSFGVSNFTVEQTRLARRFAKFATAQPLYNLLQPDAERDILPYCCTEGLGTLVYSPLHMGLLTGKYTGNERFTDVRATDADFVGDRFKELAARVRSLKPIADRYAMTTIQLVLAATLYNPAVSVVIVGVKEPAHIEEAAAVMGRTITREDYYHIRDILGT